MKDDDKPELELAKATRLVEIANEEETQLEETDEPNEGRLLTE